MKRQKIKMILVMLMLLIILLLLVFFTYKFMKVNNLDSQYVSGLLGAIVGGVFTLMSVWITTELQEITKNYNELPLKIRKLSKLSNILWELKEEIGQNQYSNINNQNDKLLDLSSEIDGRIYSMIVPLREQLLSYYYKNLEGRGNRNEIGESVFIPSSEYIAIKQNVYEQIIEKYKDILKYEERLTKTYKE